MFFDPDDPTIPREAAEVVSALALSRRARYAAYDFETVLMLLGEKAARTFNRPEPVDLARMMREHADHLTDVAGHLHILARQVAERAARKPGPP